jgi:hypothetical protein
MKEPAKRYLLVLVIFLAALSWQGRVRDRLGDGQHQLAQATAGKIRYEGINHHSVVYPPLSSIFLAPFTLNDAYLLGNVVWAVVLLSLFGLSVWWRYGPDMALTLTTLLGFLMHSWPNIHILLPTVLIFWGLIFKHQGPAVFALSLGGLARIESWFFLAWLYLFRWRNLRHVIMPFIAVSLFFIYYSIVFDQPLIYFMGEEGGVFLGLDYLRTVVNQAPRYMLYSLTTVMAVALSIRYMQTRWWYWIVFQVGLLTLWLISKGVVHSLFTHYIMVLLPLHMWQFAEEDKEGLL